MEYVSENFNLISFASFASFGGRNLFCTGTVNTSFTAKDAEGRKGREEETRRRASKEQEEKNEEKKKSLNSRALLHSILTPLCLTTAAHLLRSRSKNWLNSGGDMA